VCVKPYCRWQRRLAEAHDLLSVSPFFSLALAVLHPRRNEGRETNAAGCQELMQLRMQLTYTQYGYTVHN
jgi:hypothetical protein